MNLLRHVWMACALLLISPTTYADILLFANLTNAAENPPTNPTTATGAPRPASFGIATFDLNDAMTAMTFTPFSTGVGGVFSGKWDAPEGNNTTLAAQLPNILTGHSYINFHTTQFGGGEIRGIIQTVPDRGTSALLLACGLIPLEVLR